MNVHSESTSFELVDLRENIHLGETTEGPYSRDEEVGLRDGAENVSRIITEPPHDKTDKMICAPSEHSDQPGSPPSLIRVFAVHMKKAWVLSYPLSAQRRR